MLPGGSALGGGVTDAFVWGHTRDDTTTTAIEGESSFWPYALRIRYRLHDANGSFSDINDNTGQPISGRWFEQIVPIRRPAPDTAP